MQFCMLWYFRKARGLCMDTPPPFIYLSIVAVKVLLRIFYRFVLMLDQEL